MHLLVTGGTGFFGKALLRHWQQSPDREFRATILSRNPERFRAEHGELLNGLEVDFVAGDVSVSESLPPSGDFTHLIHAATESTLGPTLSPRQRFDHSVNGTRNVLDLAVRLGVRRVLYTSSGGVYGPPPPDMDRIPETFDGVPDPLVPDNAYSIAKRVGEHLCALYAHEFGLEPVVARCFAFVGEDLPLDVHFAIGNFVRDAIAGREIVINGDGAPIRSYLDQRDLAEWLLTTLVDGTPGRAYNVGSDRGISILALAELVRDIAGSSAPVRILGKAPGASQTSRNVYVPETSRAATELGLKLRYELPTALTHMIERLRLR